MLHKLENMLNLPENESIVKSGKIMTTKKNKKQSFRNISEFDKISAALPPVSGLGDMCDEEFDMLAERATNAYDDLMDLGMNVEPRYSARLFEVASSMLKNALDAKSAKIDKKLKTIELQLKKQKMDNESSIEDNGIDIQGDGFVVSDRNSILEKLKNLQ